MKKLFVFLYVLLSIGITQAQVKFESVKIGTQTWMKKNLDVEFFRNGDPIPNAQTDEEWEKAGQEKRPAWCYYEEDGGKVKKYGKLYNWYALNDARGLAPEGFHLASRVEWDKLDSYLSSLDFHIVGIDSYTGQRMKAISGWNKNGNGNNKSGFNALAGGCRFSNGVFLNAGDEGWWWTSTAFEMTNTEEEYSYDDDLGKYEDDIHSAWFFYLKNTEDGLFSKYTVKEYGFSVRCIKDAKPTTQKQKPAVKAKPVKTAPVVKKPVALKPHINPNPILKTDKPFDKIVTGKFTDPRDGGETYRTVMIGSQNWMAENLNVSTFLNGDLIPQANTAAEWEKASNEKRPAWCYYNNDPSTNDDYGKLYNWYAVNDSRGLAPAGWHVPSNDEWSVLAYYLGGYEVAGGTMKEIGTTRWETPNTGATNSSGFSGLPGGHRSISFNNYSFEYVGIYGFWWSSTEKGPGDAFGINLHCTSGSVTTTGGSKKYGSSVRCLRN